jgi:uncharacterized membrane protein YgdD (TMEM256/DUF423 family)
MRILQIAFILLAIGVILGAFGAHALEKVLDEKSLKVWNTGVLYLFIHAIGIAIIQIAIKGGFLEIKKGLSASRLLLIGILLFSGSLFLLSTQTATGVSFKWLGPVTPIGGVCFIAGWLTTALAAKG